jgi:hypothetical protein
MGKRKLSDEGYRRYGRQGHFLSSRNAAFSAGFHDTLHRAGEARARMAKTCDATGTLCVAPTASEKAASSIDSLSE